MKTNRLSHSQANKYSTCAYSWMLHYLKRFRSKTISSALLFGSALDSAIEHYLLNGKVEAAREVLIDSWTNVEINKIEENLPTSAKVTYSDADYDKDLLDEEDLVVLKATYGDDVMEQFNAAKARKNAVGYVFLKKSVKVLYNHVNWFSMYRKGLLMFDKTVELLDANVTEVLDVQRKISLVNDEGDEIIGYVDFVVMWRGYTDPIVFDLKTSSMIYERDSVKTSTQLGLYMHDMCEEFDTRTAGYLVMNKRIKKNRTKICKSCNFNGSGGRHKTCSNIIEDERCNGEWDESISPEVMYQIIIDEIPQKMEDMIIENMDLVNQSIKTGIYPRNFDSCERPWGPCEFYNICHNDNMDGVIELPKEEE